MNSISNEVIIFKCELHGREITIFYLIYLSNSLIVNSFFMIMTHWNIPYYYNIIMSVMSCRLCVAADADIAISLRVQWEILADPSRPRLLIAVWNIHRQLSKRQSWLEVNNCKTVLTDPFIYKECFCFLTFFIL